jgi:glycosyltransferase involved in cell wall biosynthesis
MKILQVIPVFSALFGGPVTVVRSICKELSKRHEVIVYTTAAVDKRRDFKDFPVEDESEGYRVVYFPRILKISGFNISPAMEKTLRESISRYDAVHLHSWRHFQDIIVHRYAKKYNVPYILQTHGSLPRVMVKRTLKWIYDISFGSKLLKDASKVVALSYTEAEQYKAIGVSEEKIAIIPNGIDLSEYAELPPKGSFKKKFNIPDDKRIILYLGRIHKIKGIDFLVKAYAYLINEMKCRDAILVIAGPDDGYISEIKSLVQSLDISNSVLFVGALYGEDKLAAYIDSEVYVLPSRYETFPMTLLEAYACGKTIVASKVGGLRDLVSNGETGLLVEPGNVKQLARNIFNLLNGNDIAKEMGLKGKNFVRENFTIEKVVERLEKLYEEVVKK